MKYWFFLAAFTCLAAITSSAADKDKKSKTDADEGPIYGLTIPNGISFGPKQLQRWKVGIIITSPSAPCGGIYATVPVPTDWPEQQVKVVDEDISDQVDAVEYRVLENGVKQMLISISQLGPSETARALVTFEVAKSPVLAPADPSVFVKATKVPRNLNPFLAPSPYIESTNAKIKALAKEIVKGKETAWEQVEAIYDYVRDNVEYKDGPLKGALAALKDGHGDCEEMTSLFIALCRANRIPSRTVWVHGHCYPEFYLEDRDGKGHWIPCQAAGTRDFGGMPDVRPILQKGDNYRVPEKKEPQRYVAEFLYVKSFKGAEKPSVKFVREPLAPQ